MPSSVNIDVIRKLRVGEIRIAPESMRKIMGFGVDAVKSRVTSAKGPTDSPSLPLKPFATKRGVVKPSLYGQRKVRRGLPAVRDLTFTGDMLRSFHTRRVINNSAIASVDGKNMWVRAGMNQKREPWVVFSPMNQAEVIERFNEAMAGSNLLVVKRS